MLCFLLVVGLKIIFIMVLRFFLDFGLSGSNSSLRFGRVILKVERMFLERLSRLMMCWVVL